ncbi:MAG: GNAT family N-acetyltransferase [Candidatus Omnitrophica bacterium]|nr:GNAT family N-acetyltransferase [Candidatus Omnitrophota bacterium]
MFTIRKCHPNDQMQIKNLIVRIMGDEFPKEKHSYPTEDLDDIASAYGNSGEAFFVAVDGEQVVGTIGVKREDRRAALLRRFFVDCPYRRQKIGTELVERAIAFCRESGYEEIIFKTTSTMKNAIALCEKQGFSPKTKLDLGDVQLVKFALFFKPNAVTAGH